MDELLHIMQRLRQECPWDKAQTPQSLTRYAIEEAYEVEAAIRAGDHADIRDELGDLLLQVIFQAQMFSESGAFDFYDVVNGLAGKLIRRHPHVFAQAQASNQHEVSQLWEQIKQKERGSRRRLDDIKPGAALMQAQALQKQAAKVGFDWPDVQGAKDKLNEELQELEQAIVSQQQVAIEDELGDCFFALVNVARKLNIQSETALLSSIAKFRQRFAYIEDQLAAQNRSPEQSSLIEMDALWEQAKAYFKNEA
ncbi:nucleoside triphosphate pyrophosphohydrolase [Alkanindiges sp. WGS2144]|uniref:nucleoside triphosphate pyrophosphohydrolase n=1 Tax=Alkanindiges sp. WGS2144 TaxID=3366808 RepID=UPI0037500439